MDSISNATKGNIHTRFPRGLLSLAATLFLRPHAAAVVYFLFLILSLSFLGSAAYAKAELKQGNASWYGGNGRYNRHTANGERFSGNDFTAAHKTYPFGTVLQVSTSANKQVLVAITDRGPFSPSRVLDLSKKAASHLGIVQKGVARISYKKVSDANGIPLNKNNAFYVRLSQAVSREKAHAMMTVLTSQINTPLHILPASLLNKKGFILCAGPYKNFKAARSAFATINKLHASQDIIEAPKVGATIAAPATSQTSKELVAEKAEKKTSASKTKDKKSLKKQKATEKSNAKKSSKKEKAAKKSASSKKKSSSSKKSASSKKKSSRAK